MLLLGNRVLIGLWQTKNAALEVKSLRPKQILIMLNPCRPKKGIFSSKCTYSAFLKVFLQSFASFFQLIPTAEIL